MRENLSRAEQRKAKHGQSRAVLAPKHHQRRMSQVTDAGDAGQDRPRSPPSYPEEVQPQPPQLPLPQPQLPQPQLPQPQQLLLPQAWALPLQGQARVQMAMAQGQTRERMVKSSE